jgi:ribosomal protein S18 acetylase RimI-like enzyme
MSDVRVRRATPEDRDRVVETFVAAFEADPALRYFFPDDEYGAHAPAFAGYLFDKRVGAGTVWLVDDGAAIALWDGPTGADRVAPAVAPLDLPGGPRARLDAYDAAVHTHLPTVPHWYLGVLATHPERAGLRLGRAVMAAGLVEAARDGLPAYLETTNPRNVELYRRAGWQIAARTQVPARIGRPGLDVWVMVHDGRDAPGGPDGSR